MQEE
jgi:hypothetical protein